MRHWLLVLCLAGCARRAAPVSVVREGGDYLFRFGHCGDGEEAGRIMDLTVYPIETPDRPVCSLVLTHDPHMTIAGQWRYGEVPPAYKKKVCDPLPPGHRYRLEVTHATLDFEVGPSGEVRALATSCR
jgi:hypothetical protein